MRKLTLSNLPKAPVEGVGGLVSDQAVLGTVEVDQSPWYPRHPLPQ